MIGNYYADENGMVSNIDNSWVDTAKDWIMINGIDLIKLIAIVIIVTFGLKMIVRRKEKDILIIYTTIVGYVVLRLFWRVVLHV